LNKGEKTLASTLPAPSTVRIRGPSGRYFSLPTGPLPLSIPASSSRWRAIALPAVLLLVGLLVGATVAEVVLRVYSRFDRSWPRLADSDPLNVQVAPFGTLGYRQRPHARFHYRNGTVATADSLGYRGPEITRVKPAGVVRVVLLGGSTTHGWGVNDDETIDAHMRRLLSDRSSPRFEVINAALDGYDSRQILERIQHDVLRLTPDVIIVNSGINDVRNARIPNLVDDDPRTLIWQSEMDRLRRDAVKGPSLMHRAEHYSLLLRLPRFILNRSRWNAAPDTAVAGFPEAAGYFERNMRRIAELARQHGVALVFSTAPSSLRTRYAASAPPEKGYWLRDAGTTAAYRDTLAARMRRVSEEMTSKGFAIPYLRVELPPEQFLDDAHLTSDGNASMARALTDAVLKRLRMCRELC
jgi:lysophospholipase L1-like esterase